MSGHQKSSRLFGRNFSCGKQWTEQHFPSELSQDVCKNYRGIQIHLGYWLSSVIVGDILIVVKTTVGGILFFGLALVVYYFLYIAFKKEAQLSQQKATFAGLGSISGKHILLVDDDVFLLAEYIKKLTGQGAIVESAMDGVEGLMKLKSKKYDLVITDILMPRMDGIEMLKMFRKTKRRQGKMAILSNLDPIDYLLSIEGLGISEHKSTQDMTSDQFLSWVSDLLRYQKHG